MTPEEINKKAKEAFPDGVDEKRDTAMLRLGFETAYEEISAMHTIKGWVARNKHGALIFFHSQPKRGLIEWVPITDYWMLLDRSLFPSLRWEDEPIEVELPIIRK